MLENNKEKYTTTQRLVIISLIGILVWDIFFNKNVFNVSHLALSAFIVITIFDKYKFDFLNIKIPGLLEVADSNKEINKNIEKIVNKIQVDTNANSNANAVGGPTNIYVGGDPYKPEGTTYIK